MMDLLRKSSSYTVLLLVLLAAATHARPLRLCHTNDFHARYTETNSRDSSCDALTSAAGDCFSGIARVAAAFKALRCDLRIQAGDFVQGTVYDTIFRESIAIAAYRWAAYDIATLGNHEFDKGDTPIYNTVLQTSDTLTWLNANVNFSAPPKGFSMPGSIDRHAVCWASVVTKTTEKLASPSAGTKFFNETTSIREAIARCAQTDRVIAITHQGYEADLAMCEAVPEIDLIIGGHSHTNLDDGRYPVRVTRADGSICFVTQTYAFGRYVGVVDVDFDDSGTISLPGHQYVALDHRMPPDATVAAKLKAYSDILGTRLEEVIGSATADIDGSGETCRSRECPMGNLVADALLREGGKVGAVAAFINGGGVRASIPEGPITIEEVFTVLPFGNVHAFVTMTGQGIVNVLEHGLTALDDTDSAGRFPQVSGMTVTADFSKPTGKRVQKVVIAGKPLKTGALYKVVTNDYLAQGGDGYGDVQASATEVELSGRPLYELLIEYLQENNPYTPFTEGRIVNSAA